MFRKIVVSSIRHRKIVPAKLSLNKIPKRSHLLAVSLTGLLGIFGFEKNEENDFSRQIEEVQQLVQEGNTTEAKNAILNIIEWSKKDQASENLNQLATLAFHVGEYEKARNIFTNVLEQLQKRENGLEENSTQILNIRLKLAQISEKLSQYSVAEEQYSQCLNGAKNYISGENDVKNPKMTELWIQLLESYAEFRVRQGDKKTALEYFEKAYESCLNLYGDIHEETLWILKNLGNLYLQAGDLERGIKFLEKASKVGEHYPNSKLLSSIHVALGNTYLKRGLFEEARSHCDNALTAAVHHLEQKDLKEASQCVMEAINALKQDDK